MKFEMEKKNFRQIYHYQIVAPSASASAPVTVSTRVYISINGARLDCTYFYFMNK